jgi:hypothetical protein
MLLASASLCLKSHSGVCLTQFLSEAEGRRLSEILSASLAICLWGSIGFFFSQDQPAGP